MKKGFLLEKVGWSVFVAKVKKKGLASVDLRSQFESWIGLVVAQGVNLLGGRQGGAGGVRGGS